MTLFNRIADSVALRSDCADAKADQEMHCPHISEDPFSHDAVQIVISI